MTSNSSSHNTQLAAQILHLARRQITSLAPLMLIPVYTLRDKAWEVPGPMATDGTHLLYHPDRLVQDFRENRNEPARQLLHVTLHCLLGHVPTRRDYHTPQLFDALADQKVNWFIQAMGLSETGLGGHHPSLVMDRPLPALYAGVVSSRELCKSALRHAHNYAADDHTIWSLPPDPESGEEGSGQGDKGREEDQETSGGLQPCDGQEDAPDWSSLLSDMMEQARSSPSWGAFSGALSQEFEPMPENQISYREFLRRFVRIQERLQADPDSIDPRWYHVGLELYGDLPLLEPSELSEPPMPDDLVIALDTSGSCDGAICRRFLRETLNLLRDITTGVTRFRLLLLQCDTCIQQELLLTEDYQLNTFLDNFTPRGFGGTDFCPVFRRVEALRRDGTLPQVRGLLYLSDTYGSFPKEAPDYPVTFLIPDKDHGRTTPDWVTQLHLDTDDFTLKEAH